MTVYIIESLGNLVLVWPIKRKSYPCNLWKYAAFFS